MAEENTSEGITKTLFNASMAKLQRIDSLKKGIIESALIGDLKKRFLLLLELNTELWEKMNKDERALYSIRGEYMKKLRDSLAMTENIGPRGSPNLKARNECFIEQTDYYRKLIEIEGKYGMSMIDRDDDGLGDGEF